MLLARAWVWLFLTACCLGAHATPQDDLIIQRSVFVEPAPGLMTIEEASTQQYKPFGTILNRGFSPTIRWLKLRIQVPEQHSQQVVLRVGPHYIGEIRLFEQSNGIWTSRVAGDHYPVSQHACADNLYCFKLKTEPGPEVEVYLRINTINGFFLTTRAMVPESLSELIVDQQRIFGLECGAVLAICLWSLVLYYRTRNRLVGMFLLSQIATLLFNLSSSGWLAGMYFENHVWLDNLTFNTLYIFRLFFSLLVANEFLSHYGAPRWFSYYIKGAIGILCIELAALNLDDVTLAALNFNFLLVATLPLTMLVGLLWCRKMPELHRRLIAVCVLAIFVLIWIDILPVLGWFRPDIVSAPGNWGGLLAAVALSVMVASDVSHRRVVYDREMQELQFMRTRNLVESEQIKERSMLIDMLTHELKNPLATMRMAAGSLRRSLTKQTKEMSADSGDRIDSMIQAINNMNTVIERCVQVDQLDQKGFSPKYESFDVSEAAQAIIANQAEAQRIEFRTQASSIMLHTDPNLFAIVLSNLLDNALKYSQPDSKVLLEFVDHPSTAEADTKFMMRVTNSVIKNSAPDPDSLFNRYYRGPYAHEKSGTGLGLYLVKSLCKILDGSIRFEQKDGQVKFIVELKR